MKRVANAEPVCYVKRRGKVPFVFPLRVSHNTDKLPYLCFADEVHIMTITSVNPATGRILESFNAHTWDDVSRILEQTVVAQHSWKDTRMPDRAVLMHRAAEILRARKDDFARAMTLEMGKPIKQSVAEAEKCAWVCDFYADNAASFLAEEYIETDASESYVRFDPLGVVLAVMPWNFPFWPVC